MTEVERKIQLTRFIREENAMNRMKIKNRENILYGSGKPQFGHEELPLVHDGYLGEEEFGSQHYDQGAPQSTFGMRVLLAILLFGAVVYMDRTGTVFRGELAAQAIARQVSVSAEENLIDFISEFPYFTADDEQ